MSNFPKSIEKELERWLKFSADTRCAIPRAILMSHRNLCIIKQHIKAQSVVIIAGIEFSPLMHPRIILGEASYLEVFDLNRVKAILWADENFNRLEIKSHEEALIWIERLEDHYDVDYIKTLPLTL